MGAALGNIVVGGVEFSPVKAASKPRKIHVCFSLSMPNKGSWDGKWTGDAAGHYIFKEFSPSYFEKNKDRFMGDWNYHWSDGWSARISSFCVTGAEKRKLAKANKGFSGYNWMVASILLVGEILTEDDLRVRLVEMKQDTVK